MQIRAKSAQAMIHPGRQDLASVCPKKINDVPKKTVRRYVSRGGQRSLFLAPKFKRSNWRAKVIATEHGKSTREIWAQDGHRMGTRAKEGSGE